MTAMVTTSIIRNLRVILPNLTVVEHIITYCRPQKLAQQKVVLTLSRKYSTPNNSSYFLLLRKNVRITWTEARRKSHSTSVNITEEFSEVTNYLSDIFSISMDEAANLQLLLKVRGTYQTLDTIQMKINMLQGYNIPVTAIQNQSAILKLSFVELCKRLQYLSILGVDVSKHSEEHLESIINDPRSATQRRKEYLALRLNCSMSVVEKLCKKHSAVIYSQLQTLKENLDTVLDQDPAIQNVLLKGENILGRNPKQLKGNLYFLKEWIYEDVKNGDKNSEISEDNIARLEARVNKPFTNLLFFKKSKLNTLRNFVEHGTQDLHILKDKTKLEYLAERLSCTTAEIEKVSEKLPRLLTAGNYSKLDKNISLLLDSGYIKSNDILRFPLILFFSSKSLERRITQLKEIGCNDEKFFLKSFRKQYNSYFKKSTFRFLMDREILQEYNCANRDEYIKVRLQCTDEELQSTALARARKTVNLITLKNRLDYLCKECKIPPEKLRKNTQILFSSLETVRARKLELEELGVPWTVGILSMSREQYKKEIAKKRSRMI